MTCSPTLVSMAFWQWSLWLLFRTLGIFCTVLPSEHLTTPTSAVAGIVMRVKDCRGLGLAFLRPYSSQNKLADSPGADAGLEAASAGSAAKAQLQAGKARSAADRLQQKSLRQSPGISALLSPGPASPRHTPRILISALFVHRMYVVQLLSRV